MPMPAYQSARKGDDLSEAAQKIAALEVIDVQTEALPQGEDAAVEVALGGGGTAYRFGIPKGDAGAPGGIGAPGAPGPQGEKGTDLFSEMTGAGFDGTRASFYAKLRSLITAPLPYEHKYLGRYTHEELADFTYAQLMHKQTIK